MIRPYFAALAICHFGAGSCGIGGVTGNWRPCEQAGGGPDEFETFEAPYPVLRRFAAVVADLDMDPYDLVQEALAATLQRHRLSELDQPAAYLKRAIMASASNYRRQRSMLRRFLPKLATGSTTTDSYPSGLSLLDSLSPTDRIVVFLADVEGLPHALIADQQIFEERARRGTPRGATKVWIDAHLQVENLEPGSGGRRSDSTLWFRLALGFCVLVFGFIVADRVGEGTLVEGMSLVRVMGPFDPDAGGIDRQPSTQWQVFADLEEPFGNPIVGLEILDGGGFRPWGANLGDDALSTFTSQLVRDGDLWAMDPDSGLVEVATFTANSHGIFEFDGRSISRGDAQEPLGRLIPTMETASGSG
ncbi:MAG: sigma-70 family RNA polymerase sigma factor [Actinomycetia bacterium]|nr:sigma-70 family RNA polymerase sigma factor [Actinomycetes bacterium]